MGEPPTAARDEADRDPLVRLGNERPESPPKPDTGSAYRNASDRPPAPICPPCQASGRADEGSYQPSRPCRGRPCWTGRSAGRRGTSRVAGVPRTGRAPPAGAGRGGMCVFMVTPGFLRRSTTDWETPSIRLSSSVIFFVSGPIRMPIRFAAPRLLDHPVGDQLDRLGPALDVDGRSGRRRRCRSARFLIRSGCGGRRTPCRAPAGTGRRPCRCRGSRCRG